MELLFTSRTDLQTERLTSAVFDADWNWHSAQLQVEIPANELYGRITSTAGTTETERTRWSSVRLGNPAASLLWPIQALKHKFWGGIGATVPIGGNADDAPLDVAILQQRAFEATMLNRGRVDEYLFAIDRAAAMGRLQFDHSARNWALDARSDLMGLFPVKDAYRGVDVLLQLRLSPRWRTSIVDVGVEGNTVLSLIDARDQAQFSIRPFVEHGFEPFVIGAAALWNIDEPGRQYPWGGMLWLECHGLAAE